MIEESYYFQRHSNPMVSLWHLWKNIIKMWRVKVTPLLIFLLGLLAFFFAYLFYLAASAEFERSYSWLNIVSLILFMPAFIFIIDNLCYLIARKSFDTYRLKGLRIAEDGIEFEFKDSKEFIKFQDIGKISYNPYWSFGANIFAPSYLIRTFASFLIFYNVEIKNKNGSIKNIKIPLDINKIDLALEVISKRLEPSKVKIGFFEGKPTTSYIPGVTRPEFAHEPIGKWVLLFLIILIFIIWFVYKFFLK